MKLMNSENLIETLKQALLFYSKNENYEKNLFHEKGLIYSDHGEQARFALKVIDEYENSELTGDLELDQQKELDLFNDMIKNLKNNG